MTQIGIETRINEHMQAQFKEQRFALINTIKELRAERNKLKGVKGTTAQWDALTAKIDDVQKQIDLIGKSLGIKPRGSLHMPPAGTPQGVPYKEVKKAQVRAGRDLDKSRRRSHRGALQARAARKVNTQETPPKNNFVQFITRPSEEV